MTTRLVIRGGQPLSGTVKPVGNKNAVLPMMAACLLTDQPLVLRNVPRIQDVFSMLDLLEQLGVAVNLRGHRLTLCAAGLRRHTLDADLCRRVRSSILLAGPLAARHGRATLRPPGGDVIGRRRVDTHFLGLRALGIQVEAERVYRFTRKRLRGADIILDEASVTATENILMAAVLAPGSTTIFPAACEPHVTDLAQLLIAMGARIRGLGTNRLEIEGVSELHGATHAVSPDYIEVGSFLAAAAATGGSLRITDLGDPLTLSVIGRSFAKLGVTWTIDGNGSLVLPQRKTRRVRKDFGEQTPKLEDGIWPAFPSDLMSVAIVLASQVHGSTLFFEKLFESRLYFVDHLIAMGANVVQCDPHRALVSGPSVLHGSHLSSPDIRAGMALIIAALCAKGVSTIANAKIIDRGYERIDKRLRALGADIRREKD
jgi:UDP-N-acetylglucosamine 1-carboxyvinyltransferase